MFQVGEDGGEGRLKRVRFEVVKEGWLYFPPCGRDRGPIKSDPGGTAWRLDEVASSFTCRTEVLPFSPSWKFAKGFRCLRGPVQHSKMPTGACMLRRTGSSWTVGSSAPLILDKYADICHFTRCPVDGFSTHAEKVCFISPSGLGGRSFGKAKMPKSSSEPCPVGPEK